jgi:hypothetical protein
VTTVAILTRAMDEAQRHARNEAVMRQLNEGLAEHDEAGGMDAIEFEFVCECYKLECGKRLRMSAGEWRRLHPDEFTFVIFPGHEDAPAVEEVIERGERYWIVRKRGAGAAATRDIEAGRAN